MQAGTRLFVLLTLALLAVAALAVLVGPAVVGDGADASVKVPATQSQPSPATQPFAKGDWPMFRGTAEQTGVAGSTLPEKLQLVWTHETKSSVRSTAAIVKDTVYVGDDDGRLHALRLADGTRRWVYKAGDVGIQAAPLVVGGGVYVGDLDGVFHAVDAATGRRRWTFKTEDQIISSAGIWGRTVLVGSYDQSFYGLDLATGRQKWKFETDAPVHGSPCVVGDVALFGGCDGQLRAIDLRTGRQRYAVELEDNIAATAAHAEGDVFLATYAGRIVCVDLVQQAVIWQRPEKGRGRPFYASAAVAGDRVVFAGRDHLVRCLNRHDGSRLWTYKAGGQIDSSPVIVGRRVLVGTGDGFVVALSLDDGKRLWQFEAGSSVSASPAVGGGRLVIGAEDGAIYCFGAKR